MKRRQFLHTSGTSIASVLLGGRIFAAESYSRHRSIQFPDMVSARVNGQFVKLAGRNQQEWIAGGLVVSLRNTGNSLAVDIQAPKLVLNSVTLHWNYPTNGNTTIMNDQWERTYGDASWHRLAQDEILPWYFMEHHGGSTHGFGVKTGARAFCAWQVKENQLSLTLDTASGGDGVRLNDRKLQAAEIVTIAGEPEESPYQVSRIFMSAMCGNARMPSRPVYGINDWYFSYGNNSEKLILEHTGLMAPLADGLDNRPFSVIDAGWFVGHPSMPNDCCWGDNMDTPNAKFGDMHALATRISGMGMRPGIWTRPLCGSHKDPKSLLLPMIAGREVNKPVLDPTIPENLERIRNYFKLYAQWGYEMVKFDFTSFDLFGKWGFEMTRDKAMSPAAWAMNDRSKTNAEIVLDLYGAIREAAGKSYLIGCNTFSHLSAGLFELNRVGDDTSGQEWERTRKMGVNTLAFRGLHQGTFYAADGDCVGLTKNISWERNKQWMELLAKSGTPLFISAQPDATGMEQKSFIRQCFGIASKERPVAEPLDWMTNPVPRKWKAKDELLDFNWS